VLRTEEISSRFRPTAAKTRSLLHFTKASSHYQNVSGVQPQITQQTSEQQNVTPTSREFCKIFKLFLGRFMFVPWITSTAIFNNSARAWLRTYWDCLVLLSTVMTIYSDSHETHKSTMRAKLKILLKSGGTTTVLQKSNHKASFSHSPIPDRWFYQLFGWSKVKVE
jgi:hypothetical protein